MEGTACHLEDGSLQDLTEVNILINTGNINSMFQGEEDNIHKICHGKMKTSTHAPARHTIESNSIVDLRHHADFTVLSFNLNSQEYRAHWYDVTRTADDVTPTADDMWCCRVLCGTVVPQADAWC